MARKAEVGIEYFPINSDIIHNPKIKLLVAEFGSKVTWAVLLPLYCKIYREKGYWIDWLDEDSKMLFAHDECKIEVSVLNEFVSGCIRRSLFDKRVFDMFGILTSDRIQDNYLVAKSRNKEVFFIKQFALKNEKSEYVYKLFQNVNIIDLNVNIISKKVNTGTQNKKEIIEEEEKGEGESAKSHTHSQSEIDLFEKLQVWINKNTPRINQMKQPLTIEEYLKLKDKYSKEVITNVLIAMQNRADLLKKYVSANLTINNWAQRENGTPSPSQSSNAKQAAAAINQIENGN